MEDVIQHLVTWLSLSGGVWGLFALAEHSVRPEVRRSVSQWLRNPAGSLERWPVTFAKIFDSVFGERHLSQKCFVRSSIASFVSVSIMTVAWLAAHPFTGNELLDIAWLFSFPVIIFTIAMIFNIAPDYFSLLETRYVISWMPGTNITGTLLLLAFDFVATTGIFLGGVCFFLLSTGLYAAAFGLGSVPRPEEFSMIFELLPGAFTFSGPRAIFFYSTYFTSVWLWLYALSGLAVRLAKSLGKVVSWLDWLLDIDERPLHSIGLTWSLLITVLYVVMLFLTKTL